MENFFSDKYLVSTDCIFLSAQKPPKVCQDYSICNSKDKPYLIICDGCGSSQNTDIGSRILAHSAKNSFNYFSELDYKNFGLSSISLCSSVLKTLELKDETLDSTLIFSKIVDNRYIETYMYGDGFIFSTDRNKNLKYIQKTSFEKNAPFYLSYKINRERQEMYEEYFEGIDPIKVKITNEMGTSVEYSSNLNYNNQSYCELHNTELHFISSDGIDSFVNIKTGERIESSLIINEIIKIKSKNGEFVKRRVRRMLEDLASKDIYNFDDISIAAFLIEENK